MRKFRVLQGIFTRGVYRLALTTFFERTFSYCARFSIASRNLGFRGAFWAFVWMRSGSKLRSIDVPRLERSIFFRSYADKGVISHFFYPGTRIIDTPEFPVRVIVDAGANVGMETIRLRHFHRGASVLCIEPSSDNFSVLQKNVAADAGFVETMQNGLWSSETALCVVPGAGNEAFSVRPVEAGETGDIQAVTMNGILARVGGEIDILKMDIEGAEYEVFSKNTEWVQHVKAFIFECPDADHPGATAQIFRTLDGLDFDAAVSGENIVLIRRDTGWKVETTAYL
jgi:FkbM family methyltransferase